MPGLLCAVLLAASTSQPLLVFRGNVALVDDVYRAELDLPAGTRATPANARMVASRLRSFLHRAGYALAAVRAHAEGDQIVVDIDEGRLDKIIFLGGGAFETLRLRLDLNLSQDVYNQPELERQLRRLAQRIELSQFAYEVVPVAYVAPPHVQLDEMEKLKEMSMGLVRPGRPYELHILVQPGVFRAGVSPELEVDSLEGGGLGATYHTGRLLRGEDRLDVGGRAAGALRDRLDGTGARFVFTRAAVRVEYDAQPIAGVVRPSLVSHLDLANRQRPDLHLESVQFATLEGAAQVLITPGDVVRASLGVGVERRLLFGPDPVAGQATPMPVTSIAQTRNFGEASLTLTFDPEALRRDRHHRLTLDARVYSAPHPGDQGALHLYGHWQKMFAEGWNEFWLQASALSRTGYVLFPEEQSVGGDPLHGPFGAEYARRLGAFQAEYRYSLLRDVFKVGLFNDAIAYGAIDRSDNHESMATADAFGIGFHALLIDEFALDAYFGIGFASGGKFDRGASLSIKQAF